MSLDLLAKRLHDVPFQNRPRSTSSFEQEFDLIFSHLTHLGSRDHGPLIDKILLLCEYDQVRYLWTKKDSYRIPSSFIRNKEDVQSWTNKSVLPFLDSETPVRSMGNLTAKSIQRASEKDNRRFLTTGPNEHLFRTSSLPYIPLSSQVKKRHLQDKELSRLPRPVACQSSLWSSHESTCINHGEDLTKRKGDGLNDDGSTRTHYNMLNKARPKTQANESRRNNSQMDRSQTAKSMRFINDSSQKERQTKIDEFYRMFLKLFGHKWDDYQRRRFLELFVKLLQPSDVFYLYGLLLVRMNRDFISLLPEKLSHVILSFLSPKELCVVAKVCKRWNILSSSDFVWTGKCKGVYIGIPVDKRLTLKQMFLKNRKLLQNRSRGVYKIEEIHSGLSRVTSFSFQGDVIAVAGEKIIKVWNMKTGRSLSTLSGHQKGILTLKFYSSFFLLSCSNDSTIKMWNFETGICLRTFVGHDGGVWTIQEKQNILISGSVDKTAKVWSLVKPKLLATLQGHGGAVSSVDMDDTCERVFTASTDKIIRIWDWREEVCTFNIPLSEEGASYTLVSYAEEHLLCAAGTLLVLWNINPSQKMKLIRMYRGHKSKLEAISLRIFDKNHKNENSMIVSASWDGKLKYWSLLRDECIASTKLHNHPINNIQCDDVRIMCSSPDSIIKVLKFID